LLLYCLIELHVHNVNLMQYSTLIFSVFPGADNGKSSVYEDDGSTTAYVNGEFAWTHFIYDRVDSTNGFEVLNCSVVTESSFDSMLTERKYGFYQVLYRRVATQIQSFKCSVIVKVVNSNLPSKVLVDSQVIPFSRYPVEGSWSYDGDEMTLVCADITAFWQCAYHKTCLFFSLTRTRLYNVIALLR
jgi:hypothetical protein